MIGANAERNGAKRMHNRQLKTDMIFISIYCSGNVTTAAETDKQWREKQSLKLLYVVIFYQNGLLLVQILHHGICM